MHLSDGEIRSFHSNELPAGQAEYAAAHLENCVRCQKKNQRVLSRMQLVSDLLENLPSNPQPVQAARLELKRRLVESQKEQNTMSKTIFARLPRAAWVILAAAAILAIALAFPTVRVIATSFLGLFRVEQVQVIPVDLESFPDRFGSGDSFEKYMADELKMEGFEETVEVASLDEASQAVGRTVRLPAALSDTPELAIQPGGMMTFTVDYGLVRAVLDEIGRSDIDLPKEIDGASIVVTVDSAVVAMYGDCSTEKEEPSAENSEPDASPTFTPPDCTALIQLPSPTIDAPPGLNLSQIGEAYLQILGMTETEAKAFAANVDWTTTFVIPIPQRAEYQDVPVDGVTGTQVVYREHGIQMTAIFWVKDGILYILQSPRNAEAVLEQADSLK